MGGFATISDGTTAAATTFKQGAPSTSSVLNYEDDRKKLQAKIELLEKKIKAKDQLFEDAIATTMSGTGFTGLESRNLTAELKKRVLELKTKNKEAEDEIERLTKTVKVVEVEVREDTEPLRAEIQKLEERNYELEQQIAAQKDEIQGQRTRNEELDM